AARAPLRRTGRRDCGACRDHDAALRSRGRRRQLASQLAARASAKTFARRRARARPGAPDPRRADLRRRPHGARRLLASPVDPLARDGLWRRMQTLSRRGVLTILNWYHCVHRGAPCARTSLRHAGRVLATDSRSALMEQRRVRTLEEAFTAYLRDAGAGESAP